MPSSPPGSLIYRYLSPLKCFESGPDTSTGGLNPARDFKRFNVSLTWSLFNDTEKLRMLLMGLVSNVLEYACATLNARTNFTLYLGVNDDGLVTGIEVESYELVNIFLPASKIPVYK